MKKGILLVSAVLLLMCINVAVADDTKVSLSLKAWNNSWEEEVEFAGGGKQTFKNGSALMLGPALNVRFSNNMFVGATYLMTTSDYSSNDWLAAGDKMDISRKDLDLYFGYMFTPKFGMFAGYKTLDADLSYTYTPAGFNGFDAGSWSLKGPGIGILGNIPLGDMFALYGNFAIMFLKEETEITGAPTTKADMGGASLEIGVAFAFSSSFSANLGYKAQSFAGEDDVTKDKYTENFSGVTFGLNYTF